MKKISNNLISFALFSSLSLLCSCGGSSSEGGMTIEGLLTQGETAGHTKSASLRHGAGENIGEVNICALGECSITDDAGQWGFVAAEDFTGGELLFTIKGHGIDAVKTVTIPQGAESVEIHFQHGTGNEIDLHHLTVDGKNVEQEGHHE